jgi:WbqC-like protein family
MYFHIYFMILITEFQYFPSIILYKELDNFSNIVFEQYEHYQKMTFRNRCRVAGAEGRIDLSIPLEKGRDQRSLIKEVRISDSRNWQAEHWKTILSCYSRSPWFEFYRDELERLYRRPVSFLIDWNLACFEWSILVLGMVLKIAVTEAWQKTYPQEEWVDWRGKILPKQGVLSQQGGASQPVYHQVFEERTGFLPGMSILDLLFCEGKNARKLLA